MEPRISRFGDSYAPTGYASCIIHCFSTELCEQTSLATSHQTSLTSSYSSCTSRPTGFTVAAAGWQRSWQRQRPRYETETEQCETGGQYRARGRSGLGVARKRLTCYRCGQVEHIVRECPHPAAVYAQQAR
ncbi:hypothetical protein Scep_018925 [Stephania cephalantha]|uniref:CCHC-type domain-containing protein n=1 Tax=Stephania cephalantha TaxID=152367 RepID=A0AAP0IAV0_9MAGN